MKKNNSLTQGLIDKCCDCEHEKVISYDINSKYPLCTQCADGEVEMMGQDPHGKNWEAS